VEKKKTTQQTAGYYHILSCVLPSTSDNLF